MDGKWWMNSKHRNKIPWHDHARVNQKGSLTTAKARHSKNLVESGGSSHGELLVIKEELDHSK
jgi:hypothetical protein